MFKQFTDHTIRLGDSHEVQATYWVHWAVWGAYLPSAVAHIRYKLLRQLANA